MSANQAFFNAHAIGSKGLFLLHACDNDKDVRDPAAEMTSTLPSCHSVPTVCAHKLPVALTFTFSTRVSGGSA